MIFIDNLKKIRKAYNFKYRLGTSIIISPPPSMSPLVSASMLILRVLPHRNLDVQRANLKFDLHVVHLSRCGSDLSGLSMMKS